MVEFKDYEIDLPAIDDTCKGGNCGHQHKVKVSNKPAQPTITATSASAVDTPAQPPTPPATSDHDHSHDIRTNHKELAELMPRGVNFATCADGNCDNSTIKNSKITKKFKTCDNCNSNGVPNKSKLCPTCGIKEPQDKEDAENFWSDSDIDTEKIEDDED